MFVVFGGRPVVTFLLCRQMDRVAGSDLAPVRWVRELWCGADSQCAEGDQRAARRGGSSGSVPAACS